MFARFKRESLWIAAVGPLFATACTFLVSFDERAPTDEEDAGPAATTTATTTATTPPPAPPDAGPNPCIDPATKAHVQDGTLGSLDPTDRLTRCCAGIPRRIDSKEHCGVCGFQCAADQNCELRAGAYYCTGCASDGNAVNGRCQGSTGCCSQSFAPGLGVCAASTPCQTGATNVCNNALCQQRGAICRPAGTESAICTYP